jgi:hypothetical protein
MIMSWHYLYLAYIKASGFTQDIFREILHKSYAPAYGIDHFENFNYRWFSVLIVFYSVIFLWYKKINAIAFIYLLLIGFMVLLAATEPNRLFGNVAHFGTYMEDYEKFRSPLHLIENYVNLQPTLSVHGAHYPPGNLFLLKFFGGNIGYKIFLAFVLILSFTLFYILSNKDKDALKVLLFIPAFMIYPSLDFVVISLFFFLFILLLDRINTQWSFLLMGILFYSWSFFSFISFIGLVYLIFHRLVSFKKLDFQREIVLCFNVILGFLMLFLGFKLQFNFDLVSCFFQSLEHNVSINSSPFDNPIRYLFRSTGNFFSFLIGAGVFAGLLFVKCKNAQADTHRKTLLLTLIVLSFSGLFYLETDRVWFCFLPILAWISALFLAELSTFFRTILLFLAALFLVFIEIRIQLYV